MANIQYHNIPSNHSRFILVKAEPFTKDWWYHGSSDSRDLINNTAIQVQNRGMWVSVFDTTEVDFSDCY